jgi:hypothetical protein
MTARCPSATPVVFLQLRHNNLTLFKERCTKKRLQEPDEFFIFNQSLFALA